MASDLAVTLLGFPDVKKFLEDYIRTYYTAYTHTRSRARASWRRFKSLFFCVVIFRFFYGCVSLSLSLGLRTF